MPTVLEVIEDNNWLWEAGEIIVLPLGRPATIDDLRPTKLTAEIVNGEMQVIGPPGGTPAIAGGNILFGLHMHEERHGAGARSLRGWRTSSTSRTGGRSVRRKLVHGTAAWGRLSARSTRVSGGRARRDRLG